ncbi:MAG: sulfotransferase, partial [Myxococcota bacterium]
KMPHNFQHLGLIGQLFPNARVLRMVRDPVDTCFSCFRQRFASGLPYTNALPWLGAFYNSYADLMDHWHTVSPLPILDVSYEVLVQEPEPTLRAVLDFMGMPWDPACLRFHTNRRDVGTASHDQVKKPLYTSSIGGSRRYHDHLKPLIDVLAPRHRPQ